MKRTVLKVFWSDRGGAIAPLVGLSIVALVGFCGLGIDLGVAFNHKRKLQSAVDLAALAASGAKNKVGAATFAMMDNGFSVPTKLEVTPGTYTADRSLSPQARFSEGGTRLNATRVTASSSIITSFSHLIGGPASMEMTASAIAIRAELAAFSIGSRAAALDGGIGNALLSSILGTSVTLSVLDYRTLASLKIDALTFLKNAATRGHIQAATYKDVLDGSVTVGELALALADTARATPGGFEAAQILGRLAAGKGATERVKLGDLLSFGELAQQPLTSPGSPLTVGALGMLSAGAVLANGANQISADLGVNIPGLLKSKVTLRVGEAWRTSGFVQPGTTLSTAQVRALVEVSLVAPLGLGELKVPIYVEVGRAKANLVKIACPWNSPDQRSVTLDVTTGPAYLSIGETPLSYLEPGGPRPPLTPGVILRALLLDVRASSKIEIGPTTRSLTFTDSDIKSGRIQTVTSDGLTSSLSRSLFSNMYLDVNGLPVGGILNLKQLVSSALMLAVPAVDSILDGLLATLGVQTGAADVSVDGTHCSGGALVQ
ncbi:pilus assembly protein TadG-related protein [Methylobacterium sp. CM6241]